MVSIVYLHYFIIIGETFSCICSASDSNFSNILSNNKQWPWVTSSRHFLVWLGKCSPGSKLIIRGIAIRMSWYAFFRNKQSGGGASLPNWRVVAKSAGTLCFTTPFQVHSQGDFDRGTTGTDRKFCKLYPLA